MCSDGRSEPSPTSLRSRSTSSSAAISRIRVLTGSSAISSLVELVEHLDDVRLLEGRAEIGGVRDRTIDLGLVVRLRRRLLHGSRRRVAHHSEGRSAHAPFAAGSAPRMAALLTSTVPNASRLCTMRYRITRSRSS